MMHCDKIRAHAKTSNFRREIFFRVCDFARNVQFFDVFKNIEFFDHFFDQKWSKTTHASALLRKLRRQAQ